MFLTSEIDNFYTEYDLVIAYEKAFSYVESWFERFSNVNNVILLSEFGENEEFDVNWMDRFGEGYEEIISNLSDEISKNHMRAFVKAKIEKDDFYLRNTWIWPQYFGMDFICLDKEEILVDCGAYIGDSIETFLKYTKSYKKIYAFEPDESNICKIRSMLSKKGILNVEIIPHATYSRRTVLEYDMRGGIDSRLAEYGRYNSANRVNLETRTIDDVVGNDVITYIKMDVEGAEMESLRGAERTIRKCKPVCGISAYHQQDDIINIYKLCKEYNPNYKFYFRAHRPLAIDAVLYAIP